MLFFFFEVLNETFTWASGASVVNGQVDAASFAVTLVLLLLGPILPFFLGFIPNPLIKDRSKRCSGHYVTNHNSEAQYGVAIVSGLAAVITRLITGFTFYVAPLSVSFFLIYFITCLQDGGFSPSKNAEQEGNTTMGMSFSFAILLLLLFRTLGTSVDVLVYPLSAWHILTFVLAAIPLLTFIYLFIAKIVWPDDSRYFTENDDPLRFADPYMEVLEFISPIRKEETEKKTIPYLIKTLWGGFQAFVVSIGLLTTVSLVNKTIAYPAALSTWAEHGPYFGYLIIIAILYASYILIVIFKLNLNVFPKLRPLFLWILNLCIAVVVPLLVGLSQQPFITTNIVLTNLLIFSLCFLSFVFIINFQMMWYHIVRERHHVSIIAAGFEVGIVLYIIFEVWTTLTFAYTRNYHPFLNLFWFVMMCIGFAATIPILFITFKAYEYGDALKRFDEKEQDSGSLNTISSIVQVVSLAIIMLVLVVGFVVANPSPNEEPLSPTQVKFMSYNIQWGKDALGQRQYDKIFDVLTKSNADIIGLQETDTARISNGMDDLVLYLARKMKFHSYYGPTPNVGSRGIALLSRYPINRLSTEYYANTDLTTTVIYSKVIMGGTQYTVLVTQLNQFPSDQENNIVKLLSLTHSNSTGTLVPLDSDPVVLLGDFGWASQRAYINLANIYTDSFESAGNGTGYTYPLSKPSIRRDFIYFYAPTNNLIPHQSFVETITYEPWTISDHAPVSTIFNLTSN
eukprot:gene7886-12354_t